jgi:hypothetical protein
MIFSAVFVLRGVSGSVSSRFIFFKSHVHTGPCGKKRVTRNLSALKFLPFPLVEFLMNWLQFAIEDRKHKKLSCASVFLHRQAISEMRGKSDGPALF